VGNFPVTNLGAISHHGEAALHTAFSRPRTAVFPAMPTIHPHATCCITVGPNAGQPRTTPWSLRTASAFCVRLRMKSRSSSARSGRQVRGLCRRPLSAIDHSGRNHLHRMMPDPRAMVRLTAGSCLWTVRATPPPNSDASPTRWAPQSSGQSMPWHSASSPSPIPIRRGRARLELESARETFGRLHARPDLTHVEWLLDGTADEARRLTPARSRD